METMQAFVDEYLLNPVYEKESGRTADQDVVKIITIHSAKGLEAPRCFVIDVARGLFPKRGLSEKETEEERRVLYVALTRAANELHITRAERRWSAPAADDESGYFLSDLPMELVDYGVETSGEEDEELAIKF